MFSANGPVNKGAKSLWPVAGGFAPMSFTSPKDELLGCRETAWLGCNLNFSPVYDIWGPDAVKLLNYVSVNRDYAKLRIGGSRHTIICDEKGRMMADGVLLRREDNLYRTYWLAPVLAYYVDTLGMDVQGKWVYDEFFFQLDGPKSLEILEHACGESLHDLKFAQNKVVTIAGTATTVQRLGMSGCLAYEFHGDMSKAEDVYAAVVEAGQAYGIRRLSIPNYCRNHTQAGYPNQWIHYAFPILDQGEEFAKAITGNEGCTNPKYKAITYQFFGSAADDPENAFVTPYDVDWGYLINYDHDFIGKKALLEISKNPARKVVTLEWNAEDIGKVYASQFMGTEVEPGEDIISTGDGGEQPFVMSKVMCDGEMIGVASGRAKDFYHRRMISLAFLKKEYAIEGKELIVVWGTNPETQMEIRAKVAQFPYYNEEMRNERFDVSAIPSL